MPRSPAGSTPRPSVSCGRTALPAPQRPGASRRGSCALDLLASRHALAPPRRCKLGHKGRLLELSDRAQHLTHQHGGRCVLDKVDGRPAVPPCPRTALPSRSLVSGRGRQGLSGRRSGVGQFGSRRARLLPRPPGGVFGSGGSGVSFAAASSFASAARSGSRRGARGNRSSSMARRIAAVTAAYSSSVRSIVGMA